MLCGGYDIVLVVALTMVLIIIGILVGMSLPFVLARFNLDPAAASATLVTWLADAEGVTFYLSLALPILGAPAA